MLHARGSALLVKTILELDRNRIAIRPMLSDRTRVSEAPRAVPNER